MGKKTPTPGPRLKDRDWTDQSTKKDEINAIKFEET